MQEVVGVRTGFLGSLGPLRPDEIDALDTEASGLNIGPPRHNGGVSGRIDITVDEYLQQAPEPQRSTLIQVRASLQRILPDATEGLSYGVPAFKVDGTPVAGYAYFKNHCGYYPHSGDVLADMKDELSGYDWSKGALRFPIDAALPESLLVRLVRARMQQIGR